MACHPEGKKSNGTLKKGFRWAKGQKGCPLPAKKAKKAKSRAK